MNETESEGGEGGPLNFEIGLGPAAAIDKVCSCARRGDSSPPKRGMAASLFLLLAPLNKS